ncbi:15-hydroxyprostaglandin dehydrogenase [Trichonephila clavipes]|nr:15-hydroxyprostaglandin dehydrogenase [Trichonephila clavipes]
MASAVLADPIRALQGTNRGSGPAMEESEKDVGCLEQLLLYADEHYLAGKLPLGDHLGKGPQVLAAQFFDPLSSWSSSRSRSGFPRVGTFSCPLLPTISNGTLRTIRLASNTARLPACSFHPDDQASLKLA